MGSEIFYDPIPGTSALILGCGHLIFPGIITPAFPLADEPEREGHTLLFKGGRFMASEGAHCIFEGIPVWAPRSRSGLLRCQFILPKDLAGIIVVPEITGREPDFCPAT